LLFIYNIGISFYYLLVHFVSIFDTKAKAILHGQKQTLEKLKNEQYKDVIWFHCASVGEFEQGYPLFNKLRNQYPLHKYLITFYSPSGYQFVRAKYPAEWILYLPKDTQKNMRFFIEKVNPSLVFVVKYEFWFHLLNELKKKEIPTFLLSGVFRENQFFFKPFLGSFFSSLLKKFTHLFLQDINSFELLNSIKIDSKSVAGDTRFDRVLENKKASFTDEKITQFIKHNKVFIAGSCWNEDIEIIHSIIENLPADWKIILAPHEMNSFKTNWIKSPFQFYTDLSFPAESNILILDTMGLLSKLYRFSNLTYIGGGFGKGIHNILEPAVFEHPILIGPNYQKFNEAKRLIDLGCVFSLATTNEVPHLMRNILLSAEYINEIKRKMGNYIQENTNVSDRILVFLREQGYLK
jgi:3-deoxy-D-manno-octulosonic-acid transferase